MIVNSGIGPRFELGFYYIIKSTAKERLLFFKRLILEAIKA